VDFPAALVDELFTGVVSGARYRTLAGAALDDTGFEPI
jgi:hypothetical protein